MRLGEEIDEVAVDHQTLRLEEVLLLEQEVHKGVQLSFLFEDLSSWRVPAHVQVGDDVKFAEGGKGRHYKIRSFLQANWVSPPLTRRNCPGRAFCLEKSVSAQRKCLQ